MLLNLPFVPLLSFFPQLFVGLSFPYEGPAPLEAIANGCAFLNPKFNPPKSSKNTDFFKGKPTLREVRGPPAHTAQPTTVKVVRFRGFYSAKLRPLTSCPAHLAAPVRRGLHRPAARVDRGHRELGRGGEGHPLHPQPEGNDPVEELARGLQQGRGSIA